MGNLRKQRKKEIIISIIIATIIVLAFTFGIGYFVYYNITQMDLLKEEINNLELLEIGKDEIDMNIKTKGDYGIIERKVKEYYNEISNANKAIDEITQDEKLSKIFSAENIEKDGPEFIESKTYLLETKQKIDELLTNLINITSEEYLMNLLNGTGLNKLVITSYQEQIAAEVDKELNSKNEIMRDQKEYIIGLLDCMEELIDLLANNKSAWQMYGGQIYINNESVRQDFANIYQKMLIYSSAIMTE